MYGRRYKLPRIGSNTIQAWKVRKDAINKDFSVSLKAEREAEKALSELVLGAFVALVIIVSFAYLFKSVL